MESKCKFFAHRRHMFARNYVIWRTDRENRCRGLGCKPSPEPKTKSFANAKNTARPSCIVGVLSDISQKKICCWLINQFLRNWPQKLPNFGKIKAKQWPCRSKSFEVTDFGISRKPICDFPFVINTNLPRLFLHRFQVIADYNVKVSLATGALHFNALAEVIPCEYRHKWYTAKD